MSVPIKISKEIHINDKQTPQDRGRQNAFAKLKLISTIKQDE
jgi:hypothetical protein